MKTSLIIYWIARFVAAFVMVQTLYFKFTGAEESIYIFTTIGMEPWGRLGVGVLELIASIFLLLPATVWAGSILAFGLMAGAIGMHLLFLGIEVKGDGGLLFLYAVIVALCSVFTYWKSKEQVPGMIRKWLPSFLK